MEHETEHVGFYLSEVLYRVLPTFRPDRYLEPGRRDWRELIDALDRVMPRPRYIGVSATSGARGCPA